MANEQNLIPLSQRTKEEQREIQSKGGKASGEVRRQRQQLREAIQGILDSTYKVTDSSSGKAMQLTGEQIITRKIIEVINDTNNKHWFETLQLLIEMTDSNIPASELALRERQNEKTLENINSAPDIDFSSVQWNL